MTAPERARWFPWPLAISLAVPVLIFAGVGVGFVIYAANVGADARVRIPSRGSGSGLVAASDAARYWLVLAAVTAFIGAGLLTSVARRRRRLTD